MRKEGGNAKENPTRPGTKPGTPIVRKHPGKAAIRKRRRG